MRELIQFPSSAEAAGREKSYKEDGRNSSAMQLEDARSNEEFLLQATAEYEHLSQLVGGEMHDINNMLTVTMGYAVMAGEEIDFQDNGLRKQWLDDIMMYAKKLAEINNLFLGMIRGGKNAGTVPSGSEQTSNRLDVISGKLSKLQNMIRLYLPAYFESAKVMGENCKKYFDDINAGCSGEPDVNSRELLESSENIIQITEHLQKRLHGENIPPEVIDTGKYLKNLRKRFERVAGVEKGGKGSISLTVKNELKVFSFVKVQALELEQSLENLIANSRDAINESGKHGKITLHYSSTEIGKDEEVPAGHYILFSVADDGEKGIPPDVLPRIFEPKFTTKIAPGHRLGTGLGLANVSEFVKNNHGYITVKTRPGHTEFSIYLPEYYKEESLAAAA